MQECISIPEPKITKERKCKSLETDKRRNQRERVLCEVCLGSISFKTNPLLHCQSCESIAHARCVFIKKIEYELFARDGSWLCENCLMEKNLGRNQTNKKRICALCPDTNGLMKYVTDQDIWVHFVCVKWSKSVYFSKGNPNILLRDQEKDSLGLCNICGVKFGLIVKCSFKGCPEEFHARCAMTIGLIRQKGKMENLRNNIFCLDHFSKLAPSQFKKRKELTQVKGFPELKIDKSLEGIKPIEVKIEDVKRDSCQSTPNLILNMIPNRDKPIMLEEPPIEQTKPSSGLPENVKQSFHYLNDKKFNTENLKNSLLSQPLNAINSQNDIQLEAQKVKKARLVKLAEPRSNVSQDLVSEKEPSFVSETSKASEVSNYSNTSSMTTFGRKEKEPDSCLKSIPAGHKKLRSILVNKKDDLLTKKLIKEFDIQPIRYSKEYLANLKKSFLNFVEGLDQRKFKELGDLEEKIKIDCSLIRISKILSKITKSRFLMPCSTLLASDTSKQKLKKVSFSCHSTPSKRRVRIESEDNGSPKEIFLGDETRVTGMEIERDKDEGKEAPARLRAAREDNMAERIETEGSSKRDVFNQRIENAKEKILGFWEQTQKEMLRYKEAQNGDKEKKTVSNEAKESIGAMQIEENNKTKEDSQTPQGNGTQMGKDVQTQSELDFVDHMICLEPNLESSYEANEKIAQLNKKLTVSRIKKPFAEKGKEPTKNTKKPKKKSKPKQEKNQFSPICLLSDAEDYSSSNSSSEDKQPEKSQRLYKTRGNESNLQFSSKNKRNQESSKGKRDISEDKLNSKAISLLKSQIQDPHLRKILDFQGEKTLKSIIKQLGHSNFQKLLKKADLKKVNNVLSQTNLRKRQKAYKSDEETPESKMKEKKSTKKMFLNIPIQRIDPVQNSKACTYGQKYANATNLTHTNIMEEEMRENAGQNNQEPKRNSNGSFFREEFNDGDFSLGKPAFFKWAEKKFHIDHDANKGDLIIEKEPDSIAGRERPKDRETPRKRAKRLERLALIYEQIEKVFGESCQEREVRIYSGKAIYDVFNRCRPAS